MINASPVAAVARPKALRQKLNILAVLCLWLPSVQSKLEQAVLTIQGCQFRDMSSAESQQGQLGQHSCNARSDSGAAVIFETEGDRDRFAQRDV